MIYRLKRLLKKLFKTKIDIFFDAISAGDITKVKSFLENGYDVNQKHPDWDWPAALSAVAHPDILKLLIEYNVDIDAQETNKWYTPLINTARRGKTDVVKILLENNANTHLTSFAGLPALFYALEGKYEDIIHLLLKHETDDDFLYEVISLCEEKEIDIQKYLDHIKKRIEELEKNNDNHKQNHRT